MRNRSIRFIFLSFLAASALCCQEIDGPVDPFADDPMTPEPNATVYGRVKTSTGKGVDRVVVTDGVIFARTNSRGEYSLRSEKKNSLVYISLPSGYIVNRDQSQPQFYQQLSAPAGKAERHDFILYPVPDQDSHQRYLFGDIHIFSDGAIEQFGKFVQKVNSTLNGVEKTPYGLTVGDMTWDWYWYHEGNKRIPHYLEQMNKVNMPVFCTVGNHDHDMKFEDKYFNSWAEINEKGEDWTVEIAYRQKQGPTCYSANIGKIHYISMDDAMTTDLGQDKNSARGCILGFAKPDMEWLEKDLSYVPKSTPIFLSVHIPFTNASGSLRSAYGKNEDTGEPISHPWYAGKSLATMLEPFVGYKLYVVSAHTHYLYNNEVSVDTPSGNVSFTEWNNGAVCGAFWTPAIKGLAICTDGTPAGYRVINFNGTTLSDNVYQPYEKKGFYPFRSYDRNMIELNQEKVQEFSMGYPNFFSKSSANEVYIHVWDWKNGWSISVKEGDKELPCETLASCYDPLYLYMYATGVTSTSPVKGYNRMFKVTASSATSTLTITVTDPYGHKAVEQMKRPKAMDTKAYKAEEFTN